MSTEDFNEKIKLHLKSALIGINNRNYDLAIDELHAAEVLDMENPEILYNLGVAYSLKGLGKVAEKYFEKLLKSDTRSVDRLKVRKLLAYTNVLHEEYKKAIDLLKECETIMPGDSETLNMLAYCYDKSNNKQKAIETYRTVLSISKDNATAMNSLAYVLAEISDSRGEQLNEALSLAKKAIQTDPENAAYLDTLGFIYLKRNEKNLAKKFLKSAYLKMPLSSEIKLHVKELLKI